MFESKVILDRIDTVSFEQGLFLWILHADKIPPHAGLSENGVYFSLKAKGKDSKLTIQKIVDIIERKKIPTIIIALQKNNTRKSLEITFSTYLKTVPTEITCLNPIKDHLNIPNAGKLHELLSSMEEFGLIDKVYSVFLPESYVKLPEYEEKDIHNYLFTLNGIKR